MVYGRQLTLSTQGHSDIHDITGEVSRLVRESDIIAGLVTVHAVGSTASVSTIECEPALNRDFTDALETFSSSRTPTRHGDTWGDDNGFSHIRATFMGPGITVPVHEGKPVLGTWQQIVVIDHDNRPRSRKVFVQVMGE